MQFRTSVAFYYFVFPGLIAISSLLIVAYSCVRPLLHITSKLTQHLSLDFTNSEDRSDTKRCVIDAFIWRGTAAMNRSRLSKIAPYPHLPDWPIFQGNKLRT